MRAEPGKARRRYLYPIAQVVPTGVRVIPDWLCPREPVVLSTSWIAVPFLVRAENPEPLPRIARSIDSASQPDPTDSIVIANRRVLPMFLTMFAIST